MSTSISWTRGDDGTPGVTWNPVTGCDRVSPGCDHCYALTMAKRLKAMGSERYQRDGSPATSGPGFGVTVHEDVLGEPLRWRKPRKVFVNSMSDLFHDEVPVEFLARVFAVMAMTPQHTYQVLTKRHARMRSLLNDRAFQREVLASVHRDGWKADLPFLAQRWPLPNVWLGVSVEDQKWADIRTPVLLKTPAAVRFVSCEPLLGPVGLGAALLRPYERQQGGYWDYAGADLHGNGKTWVPGPGIDWLIVGGESGRGARRMELEWARSLRDQCADAGVPFWFKQLGTVLAREVGATGKGEKPAQWPEPFPQEFPKLARAAA